MLAVFPVLVPWQRRQFSYWLTAGARTVRPSPPLIPATRFCERRIAGGCANEATCLVAWALWQSMHVACRFWLSRAGSVASWVLLPVGKGCAVPGRVAALATSAKTFNAGGETLAPLWQVAQSCSFRPRRRRARPLALCSAWH